MEANNHIYKAIDFFCGGGGMTCGLRQAGIDVIAGADNTTTTRLPPIKHSTLALKQWLYLVAQ